MIEQDTIRLLRECDSGAQMGMDAICDVLDRVKSNSMKGLLNESQRHHEKISNEIRHELERFQDEGKNPSPMASAMSWMKTHAELAVDESDHTIADLMIDGCNMGVKSLSRYLNQYSAADEKSKDLAKQLIGMEEALAVDLRPYL